MDHSNNTPNVWKSFSINALFWNDGYIFSSVQTCGFTQMLDPWILSLCLQFLHFLLCGIKLLGMPDTKLMKNSWLKYMRTSLLDVISTLRFYMTNIIWKSLPTHKAAIIIILIVYIVQCVKIENRSVTF